MPHIVLSILNMFKTRHECTETVSLRSLRVLVSAASNFPEDRIPYLRQCLPDLLSFGNGGSLLLIKFEIDMGLRIRVYALYLESAPEYIWAPEHTSVGPDRSYVSASKFRRCIRIQYFEVRKPMSALDYL